MVCALKCLCIYDDELRLVCCTDDCWKISFRSCGESCVEGKINLLLSASNFNQPNQTEPVTTTTDYSFSFQHQRLSNRASELKFVEANFSSFARF